MTRFTTVSSGIALLIAVVLLPLVGCKKYSDGPGLSLVSREERVENTWIVAQATEDGQDKSSSYDQYTIALTSDGDAILEADYFYFGVHYVVTTNGTWSFENDNENIRFDYEDNSEDVEYQILRLTSDQFWLRRIGADLELELAGTAS